MCEIILGPIVFVAARLEIIHVKRSALGCSKGYLGVEKDIWPKLMENLTRPQMVSSYRLVSSWTNMTTEENAKRTNRPVFIGPQRREVVTPRFLFSLLFRARPRKTTKKQGLLSLAEPVKQPQKSKQFFGKSKSEAWNHPSFETTMPSEWKGHSRSNSRNSGSFSDGLSELPT